MNIPFVDFKPMHKEINEELEFVFRKVLQSNNFIQGEECHNFELEFANYCETKYCVGVANGLDALYLIFKAMGIGIGDEVILPANTFIATALAVSYVGACPILVDPDLITSVNRRRKFCISLFIFCYALSRRAIPLTCEYLNLVFAVFGE